MHLTAQSHPRPCAMHRTHTPCLHAHTAPPCSSTITTTASAVWTPTPPPAPARPRAPKRSDATRSRHKRKRHCATPSPARCACAHEEMQQLKAELAHALHLLRVAVADKTEAELRLAELAQSAQQREQFLHARLDACRQQLSRGESAPAEEHDRRAHKRSSWGIVHALADPLRAASAPALVQTRLPCDGAEQRDGRRLFVR